MNEEDGIVCEACGGSARRAYVAGTAAVVGCVACGMQWIHPTPDGERLRSTYDAHYFRSIDARSIGYSNYMRQRSAKLRTFRNRLSELQLMTRGRTCLDVGSAYGFFLEVAADMGWAGQGIDVSEHACGEARARGVDVICSDALAWRPGQQYDLVTAWDVIEHLASPRHFFQNAAGSLASDGILALTTPDAGSLVARVLGPRWFEYKWPEHIFYLTRKALRLYCRDAGLAVISMRMAMKYKTLPDAIARWTGGYEAIGTTTGLSSVLIPYSSFSEVHLKNGANPQGGGPVNLLPFRSRIGQL